MKVACCQIAPRVGDSRHNRHATVAAIGEAVDAGARLIVLPELSTSGYVFRSASEVRDAAQTATGGALDEWSREAARGGSVVVGGFVERADDGTIYNAAAVVDASGVLFVYRKAHLWMEETRYFAPGPEHPPVVDTEIGRIGVAICYDLFFPEFTRALALAGAEILAVPTNAPVLNAGVGAAQASDVGVSVTRAAALVNRVFVAICDRTGIERGTRWAGRSVIADPDGRVLAGPVGDRREILVADCQLAEARRKVIPGTSNDVFGDRRPELYRIGESGAAPDHG